MKKIFAFTLPLVLTALLSVHAEEPESPYKDNVAWHSIIMIDYKPGTVDEVKALIRKFETASEAAGTLVPEFYWFESGKYDLILTWKLKDGTVDFEGKWSPYGEPWWNALVKQEGSEEAANELQATYNNLIASSVTSVARQVQ